MIGIAYIILWMINLFGNGIVIYIFLKVKSVRTPSNMFVVNLAFSDWCMMLTQVWLTRVKSWILDPWIQAPPVIINVFTQRYWMWGTLGKKCMPFCMGFLTFFSRLQALWIFRSFIWNSINYDNDCYWIWQIQCYCEGSFWYTYILYYLSICLLNDWICRVYLEKEWPLALLFWVSVLFGSIHLHAPLHHL